MAEMFKVFVACGDADEALVPGRLCPTMPNAWAEWPGSGGRVPCFLHFTFAEEINVWQTQPLRANTPLDQVVDITMPSICLYPIIFQPPNTTITAARIVRALARTTGGPNRTNTETSVVFRAPDDEDEDLMDHTKTHNKEDWLSSDDEESSSDDNDDDEDDDDDDDDDEDFEVDDAAEEDDEAVINDDDD